MRRGVTIVELMVVLTVIGVLFALFAGTISHSRQLGRRLACVSNCRSCSVAVVAYTNDYSEAFPLFAKARVGPAFENGGIGMPYFVQPLHWPLALQGYLNPSPQQVEVVQLCPSNTLLSQDGYDRLIEEYTEGYVFPSDFWLAYGTISDPAMWRDDGDLLDTTRYRAVRDSEIEYPSLKGLMLEPTPRHLGLPVDGESPTNWIFGQEAHRFAYVTAFADGRVEAVPFIRFLPASSPRNLRHPAPVLSTRDGIRGRDVSR